MYPKKHAQRILRKRSTADTRPTPSPSCPERERERNSHSERQTVRQTDIHTAADRQLYGQRETERDRRRGRRGGGSEDGEGKEESFSLSLTSARLYSFWGLLQKPRIPWRHIAMTPSVWCYISVSFVQAFVYAILVVGQPQYFYDSFNINISDVSITLANEDIFNIVTLDKVIKKIARDDGTLYYESAKRHEE